MRPTLRRRASIAIVACAVTLLTGCDALSGDAAPRPASGLFDGAVAASAFDGEVRVTADEFAEVVTLVDGDVYRELSGQDPQWEQALGRQRQVLTVVLVQDIFAHVAERDFGVEITDAEVEERLAEQQAAAGGEEAFVAQLEAEGLTLDVERLQTRWRLVAEGVGRQLGDQGVDVTAWQTDVLTEADPAVAHRFGVWDQSSLAVQAGPGV